MAERGGSGPKTVIRPPGGQAPDRPGGDVFAALARPAIDFAKAIERAPKPDPAELATEAHRLLAAFEQEARRARIRPEAILDARDALITLIDARARSNPTLPARAWTRALAAAVPLGPGTEPETLRRRAEAAARAGPAQRDLARLLRHCLEAVDAARPARDSRAGRGGATALLAAVIVAGLAGWIGWAEWHYRERLLARLPGAEAVIAAGAQATAPRRAAALDTMAAAVAEVARAAPDSPVGLVHRVPPADPEAAARREYARAADALVPAPLWGALDSAIATEGDPDALYDTLRARSILEGRSAWQPGFLAGWITDRAAAVPELAGLARHVAALSGPAPPPADTDLELLAQARGFAAEGGGAPRAFLELRRAETAGALPVWWLAAVPGLDTVLVRRSGLPLTEGIAGLYTEAGWAWARGDGIAAAIARAAAESERLIRAESTASPEQVLDLLQARTLDTWSAYLADLRVKPFTDQPSAVTISGALALRNSPLSALIREVWRQAGGEDRSRSHAQQLRIAAEYGPAIQFVEQGRMAEVSRLFAGLNVALAALGADADLDEQRLMGVQAQATSIATLQQAPTLVVQIIEDVLAQTAAANPTLGRRPEPLIWQSRIAPACQVGIAGRYPFADGPDADPVELAGLFASDGMVTAFFRDRLAPLMEMSETPWRWKPEARLSGFSADSAAFFERVAALGGVYFAQGAVADTPFSLEALAQRGAARVTLGSVQAAVDTEGAPAALRWPGRRPEQGFEIAFSGGERESRAGPWGLLRFLDGLRLRSRDDGRRYLIDVRLAEARVYLQLTFENASNPVSALPLLRGLTCPMTL